MCAFKLSKLIQIKIPVKECIFITVIVQFIFFFNIIDMKHWEYSLLNTKTFQCSVKKVYMPWKFWVKICLSYFFTDTNSLQDWTIQFRIILEIVCWEEIPRILGCSEDWENQNAATITYSTYTVLQPNRR